jgi:hypothetical protein
VRLDLEEGQLLAFGLPQHPDEYRPERPVLLAIDQQLGEGAGRWVPPIGADRVSPIEVGKHEDAEELGPGSGAEGVEALHQPTLELVRSHGWRLRSAEDISAFGAGVLQGARRVPRP